MEQSLVNRIKALCLIALAVFLFLSLISYSPNDTTFRSFPPNSPTENLTGIVGAHIAEGLIFSFGWVAYLICFLALIWAAARLLGKPAPKLYIKLIGSAVLLLSLAALLALFVSPGEEEIAFKKGGFLGSEVAGFLFKYFGGGGSLIISVALAILASFVSTEFLILPFIRWLGKGLFGLLLGLKQVNKKKVPPVLKIEKPKPLESILKPTSPIFKIIKPKPVKKPVLPKVAQAKESYTDYKLPTLDLLNSPPPLEQRQIKDDLEANSRILEGTLRDFGVEAKVIQVGPGPVVTMYELQPAPGIQINRINALSDDIALAMKAHSVRIVPIPGKSRVGVEVPNSKSAIVYLKEILESADFQNAQSKLTLALGKDILGESIVTDLAEMPHLLIAGTTGSGKTVCVNSIIASVLFNASPDEVKFVMVDPKMVELAMFNDLPHLLCPVLTDPKKVSSALGWLVKEMGERFNLLSKVGARNIDIYNEKVKAQKENEALEKMPYIIVIIDELADLMVVASQQVESAITRLAQLSRAVGIHLILATQRPSVDVVTGVIKANFPARISFRVASKVDSRTVLDMNGADKLLGKGDLLFLEPGQHKPLRAQGSLIFDNELEKVIGFIKNQKSPVYNQELMEAQEKKAGFSRRFEKDELYDEAVKVILQTKQASVSMLQRRLGLGYTRAARLVDMMEEEGIVGPYRGSKPREILVDKDSLPKIS